MEWKRGTNVPYLLKMIVFDDDIKSHDEYSWPVFIDIFGIKSTNNKYSPLVCHREKWTPKRMGRWVTIERRIPMLCG